MSKQRMLFYIKYLFFIFNFFLFFTIHVNAYIDPSVMTYAIQAIAGIAIAIGTFLNIYWRKIRKSMGLDGLVPNKYKQKETDDFYYKNPITGNVVLATVDKPDLEATDTVAAEKKKAAGLSGFWNEYKYSLILAAVLSFLIVVFSPLDYYFNNKLDFWFDFQLIAPVLAKYFFVIFAVLALLFAVALLLFDELYHVLYIALIAVFICLYLQGNYFAGKLPSIDGTAVDWSLYPQQKIESMVIWIAIPFVSFLFAKIVKMHKFYKITKFINLAVLGMLVFSLTVVGIRNDAFESKKYRVATTEHMFEMSEKQNFIILLVDAFDARIFSEVLENNPEYKEDFNDFTYFPNTVGAYTFTSYALPQLLTGIWNENETNYQTYFTEAMDQAPIFEKLKSDNYKMGMYETNLVYESDKILQFENYEDVNVGFKDEYSFLKEELKLFIYKYAPYQLKKIVNPNLYYFFQTQSINDDVEVFSDQNPVFYDAVNNETIVKTNDKCFKFIHIEGAHVPFRYNEKVELIDPSEGTYEKNVLCSISIMKAYLDKLKDAGVYDNTAIIMLGDHGFNYDNDEYWGRQNPVLMVKGIGEQHDFTISQAPISYDDLQVAYARLCDGGLSDECFDAKEGDVRKRRFMHFIREAKITEYTQEGYASDTDTLVPTGRTFERDVDYIAEFHIN